MTGEFIKASACGVRIYCTFSFSIGFDVLFCFVFLIASAKRPQSLGEQNTDWWLNTGILNRDPTLE